ncbi:MAG: DUF2834 domain-containing protein [Bauldia sp.]|nr:DUF2834 domain-containing protein [Bauldia sp.]
MKAFYLAACLVGTVVPWLFFGSFFAANGFDIIGFVRALFANGAAAGFSADVILSLLTFLIWSATDAARRQIRLWWLVLPAGSLVGLSLALPLYLYLREDTAAA